jgi:hypothetical protein
MFRDNAMKDNYIRSTFDSTNMKTKFMKTFLNSLAGPKFLPNECGEHNATPSLPNLVSRRPGIPRSNEPTWRIALASLLLVLSGATSWGTAYIWDCTSVNPTSGSDVNIVSATFNAAQGNNNGTTTLISTTSASTGYAGASGTSNFGAACKIGALSTSTSTYFEVTVTPAGGAQIALTSVTMGSRGTSTGPTAITVFSSIDGFAAAIGSATVLATSTWALSTITFGGGSLTGAASTPVTLRIYGSGGSGSPAANTANWRIDDVKLVVTSTGGCPSPTASVSGDATICDGGTTTIQAVLTGTGPWDVTWSDSITQTGVGSSPATRSVSPTTTTVYTVTSLSDASGCTPGSGTGNATVTVNQPVTPSVNVTANPGTTICAGSQVVFTALPVNGGVTPTFVWKTNGVQDTSVPSLSATYTNSSLANGETIDCQLATSLTCVTAATAEAPQLTMTISTSVTPAVSVASDHGTTICTGTTVIFTATPVNGGGAPSFIWKTNGVQDTSVPGLSATYTNISLANGDTLDCQLLSSDTCAAPTTANATPIVMTVNATFTPSVIVAADLGSSICSNASVTFTATPINGGAAPTYQWQTNTVNVTGQTASTFTTSNLKNLDAVRVVMTPSSEICVAPATATSATVTMTVNPIPSSKITAAGGVVQDSLGNTATVPDAGAGAMYVWTIANGTITAGQGTALLAYTAGNTIGTLTLGCTVTTAAGCSSVSSTNIRVHAPILVGWDVSTQAGGLNNYGLSPLSATTTDANLAIGGLTRGSGVGTTGTAAARGWGGLGWNVASSADAITADKVATFTVAANSGFRVSFNAISRFDYRRSGTGATNGMIQYQVGGADTFHDLVTVAYPSSASAGGALDPIDLSSIPALQNVAAGTVVTFRVVNFGGTSSAGSWYIFDVANSPAADFEISGYVVACATPTATLAGDATICEGASANLTTTLTGTQPWSVTWSDGVTSNNIASSPLIRTVSPNSTTAYTVTSVTDAINCAAGNFSGTATVTLNPLPGVSVNSAAVCAGGSTTLTATTSASNPSYLWSPGGATTTSITVAPASTTTYSVTVTDATTACVNSASGTVTVNPLPTVTITPATTNVECAGTVTFTADPTGEGPLTYQWYDNLTNTILGETNVTLTVSNIYGAAVGNYTIVVTGPACSAAAVANLTLIDITAPVITVNGANPATNECHMTYTDAGATVSDACAGNVSVTTNNPVNATVPGVYTVTYTADDGNGNTNTATRTVYVVDTTSPIITYSFTNLTLIANSNCQAVMPDVTGTNSLLAEDTCSSTVTITQTPTNNAVLSLGTNEVVLAVIDNAGNTAYSTNSIVVVDGTAPVITLNGANPLTVECHGVFADPGASANDNCSGGVAVTTSGGVNPNVPGSYPIEYRGIDAAGNSATNTRFVNVVDTAAPTVTVLGANPFTNYAFVPFVDPGATVADACDVSVAVNTNGTVEVATPGSYTLTYIGTDASGNSATNFRTVQVIALVTPTIANGQKLNDGGFELTFAGPVGQPYKLLSSPDAALTMSSWTVLTAGVFGESPTTYIDNSATNDPVRFYRIASP